jgi:hypothetical protein
MHPGVRPADIALAVEARASAGAMA